jgi:hypothetical protein
VSTPRPHPFALVFGALAPDRFPALREALGDDRRIEHFLMTPAALELLHELRPDEGLGDAVDDFVAFVHAAYCYWDGGQQDMVLDAEPTRRLIEISDQRSEIGAPPRISDLRSPISRYVQIAPRVLWSQVESSEIHEPIDGWFVIPEGEQLRVVACLGLHAERPGLSVMTAIGPAPRTLRRDDGTAPFAPIMEGGAGAGLHSVANAEELLWLGWRAGS